MKKAVSVCAGVMIFFFSLGIFCACSFGGMDSGTFHTVNFQYSVGNGQFDYTAQIKGGYELDEPYDEELAEDYYRGNDGQSGLSGGLCCGIGKQPI